MSSAPGFEFYLEGWPMAERNTPFLVTRVMRVSLLSRRQSPATVILPGRTYSQDSPKILAGFAYGVG
jgi:hypothetical protein